MTCWGCRCCCYCYSCLPLLLLVFVLLLLLLLRLQLLQLRKGHVLRTIFPSKLLWKKDVGNPYPYTLILGLRYETDFTETMCAPSSRPQSTFVSGAH